MVSTKEIRHPHLKTLLADVAEVTAGVETLRADLTDEQLVWKPEPGVWNVLECIEHLIVVDGLYFPRIEAALAAAQGGGKDAPFRPSFFGKTFLRYVSPDSKRKIKTFRLFEPPPALTDVSVPARFIAQQAVLTALIQRADGADLNDNTFSSPVSRLIRFSLGEGLTLLVLHQQRHLQQARRLTQHPGFPGSAGR